MALNGLQSSVIPQCLWHFRSCRLQRVYGKTMQPHHLCTVQGQRTPLSIIASVSNVTCFACALRRHRKLACTVKLCLAFLPSYNSQNDPVPRCTRPVPQLPGRDHSRPRSGCQYMYLDSPAKRGQSIASCTRTSATDVEPVTPVVQPGFCVAPP